LRLLWAEWIWVYWKAILVLLWHMHQRLAATVAVGKAWTRGHDAGRVATMAGRRMDVAVTSITSRRLWGLRRAIVAVGMIIVRRHGAQRGVVGWRAAGVCATNTRAAVVAV
jgi:hypothetical protein